MTKIQDMSSTQRNSWLVVLADGAVFAWFWQKMTVGLSPNPITYDMREFGEIVIGVIILTVILHAVIASIFEFATGSENSERDERDILIERRGSAWGYRILQIGVGFVVFGILWGAIWGEGGRVTLTFTSHVEIIFGLMVVSYIADLVKHAVMLHGYGR